MSEGAGTERRLMERLQAAGVTLLERDLRIAAEVHPAGQAFPHQQILPRIGANPLVSCLMVTSGDRPQARIAVECFQRQLDQNRELVVVTYLDRVEPVRHLLAAAGLDGLAVHGVGRDLSLGDMRNVAVARARGEILVQWDDDDLYDPGRITIARAVLTSSGAAAALLWRFVLWRPAARIAAISYGRFWEGSIALWRRHAPVYPSRDRHEDSFAVNSIRRTRPVARCDMPLVYVYVVHGANSCDDQHFAELFSDADCVFIGADYDAFMALLARRMPIGAYLEALGQSAT